MKSQDKKIELVIIDSQPLFREGLKRILESNDHIKIMAEGETAEELLPLYQEYSPDIILLDINSPHKNVTAAIEELVERFPVAKVVIFTVIDDSSIILQVLKAGISGYLLKEMDKEMIVSAIEKVVEGGFYLHPKAAKDFLLAYKKLVLEHTHQVFLQPSVKSPYHLLTQRECEVLQLLTDGHSNRTLSEMLGISDKTAKNHVSSILHKLNLKDRTQAVVTALKHGWVVLN